MAQSRYGELPEKVKNWYKEIYPNQKFDFTKHKYGVPKQNKLSRGLKSIYQYYKTVPGYYPQLISNKKTLDSIKTWFDKAIKKGPVSYTDLQNQFPAQASPTLEKALGKDFKKLTRHTPVTTKIKPKVLKIVDEVYTNKRPLIDAAPSRLYKATYGKPYKMGTSNMGTISGILDESDKYDKMRSKIKATVGRVGGGNKLFDTVKLKDFDKADIRTELPRTSGNLVEENILRDLDRYINRGGKDFKYTPDGRTNKFKTLKIKDLKKGDVLTYDRIKELIKKGDPRFKEYKKVFDNMKRLKLAPYSDPITKETTTLLQGLQKATGIQAPLHIQHNKGILESPLKNLSISTHKANIGAKMVESVEDIEKLGVRSTLPGGKRVYGPNLSFEDEVNRLTKFSDRMIKGGGTRTLKTPTETLNNFIAKVKTTPGGCQAVVRRALGAKGGSFVDTCETIIKADPERAAVKLNNAITATKGPLKNLKDDSQKLIRLFRGESFPQRNMKGFKSSAKHWGTTVAEMQKDTLSGQWYTPTQGHSLSYLSRPGQLKYVDVTPQELEAFNRYKDKVNKRSVKYSKARQMGKPEAVKHGVTESFHHQIIPRYKLKQMEEAGRLKTKYDLNPFGPRYIGRKLVEAPKGVLEWNDTLGGFVDSAHPDEIVGQNQLKAWAADNPIDVKVGTELPKANKSVLKTVGKTLAHIGAPLPTALIDSYFINKQVDEGKSTAEIAKDPLNWLGLATMEPLTKMAGANAPGGLNAVLRLGLNPATIRGITRFAGLPGLAISTAMTAYDQYKKYQNEEGFVYNLFNKEGT